LAVDGSTPSPREAIDQVGPAEQGDPRQRQDRRTDHLAAVPEPRRRWRISRRVIVERSRSRPSPDRKLAQQGGHRDVELGGQGLDGGGVLGAPVDAVTPIKGSEAVCDALKSAGGLPLRG